MTPKHAGCSRAARALNPIVSAMLAIPSLGASHAAFAQTQSATPATAASAPATAASAPAAPASGPAVSTELEQVVVTSQFRRQKQQDIPISITALSAEMLEARGQTSLTDITASAPSVTLTPAGSGGGASATASIRGVGQSDFNFAFEPGVGMYIDDVYYGVLFGSIFDLTDLDRVEILRGPQGILAGKNSIGGAIKLFSTKPDGAGGGYVEVTAGSFNRLDTRAAADFAITPEKLFARVSAVSKRQDGYMTRMDYNCANGAASSTQISNNCEIGKEGGKSLAAARLALRWLPIAGVEDNLIVDTAHHTSQVQPTKLLSQGPWAGTNNYITAPKSYTNYATYTGHPGTADAFTIPPVSTMSGWGVSNNLDIKLDERLALKSVTALRRSSGEFAQDSDASPADVQTIYNTVSHRQFSQELRLSGATQDNFFDWTTGLFYYKARQTIGGRKDIPGGIAPGGGLGGINLIDFIDDDVIDSASKSIFANLVIHPLDKLSIAGGIRYTKESKDYTFTRNTAGLPLNLGQVPVASGGLDLSTLNGLTGAYSGSKADYRIAADYRWSPELMTYAQLSTGFKGGGVNPRPFTAAQVTPFDPETLNAFEIGFKSDLFERKLRLNVSAFYNKYKDIQLTTLTCDLVCAKTFNGGNANVKGAEIEVRFKPIASFTIDASASVLKFDYTTVSQDATGIALGMITPYTPKVKYAVGAQYEFSLGDAGSVTPRLDWSHQSSMYTEAVNAETNRVDGYGLLNGRISWHDAKGIWEAALSGTNLLNKFYYLNKYGNPSAPFFFMNGQPGRPRELAMTIKRTF